jgi:hypothetical protein
MEKGVRQELPATSFVDRGVAYTIQILQHTHASAVFSYSTHNVHVHVRVRVHVHVAR